jgi:hypothetical protein
MEGNLMLNLDFQITMHRTEQNNPLGLEVQVQIPQAMCTALSEPGNNI